MIRLAVYFDPPEDFIAHLGNISDKININVCTNRDDLKNYLPETEILVTLLSWPDAEMIRLASKLKWIKNFSVRCADQPVLSTWVEDPPSIKPI
jgi:phosphoglycerate dehydrogenase-like enzyme